MDRRIIRRPRCNRRNQPGPSRGRRASIWLAAFFPPGLHPVLDGRVGDKNAMIAPQVPTGGLIGQAVLHDESHGQGDNAMGVMGFGQGVVGHVRVEVLATARTAMLRVDEVDVAGTTGNQIAHVMQDSFAWTTAKTGLATNGTRACAEVPTAMNDLGFGKIFGSRDAFRVIGQILTGARHSKTLLGQVVRPRNLRELLV